MARRLRRRRVEGDLIDEERGVFMISVAAELAHMHPQTLRMYEARGLIEPKRSPKNTRLYSQRDVERLRRIQQLTAEGLNLAGVETVLALEERVAKLSAELERARKRSRNSRRRRKEGAADAAGSIHRQVPGSGRRGAAARRARGATPRSPPPTCWSPCSTRRTAWWSRSCRSSAPTPPASPRAADEAVEALPKLGESGAEAAAVLRAWPQTLRQAEKEMAKLGDEYISTEHLLLALTEAGSGVADVLPDRDALEKAVAEVRGPAQGHLAQPRGQRAGAGEIRPRPDRRGARRASSTR